LSAPGSGGRGVVEGVAVAGVDGVDGVDGAVDCRVGVAVGWEAVVAVLCGVFWGVPASGVGVGVAGCVAFAVAVGGGTSVGVAGSGCSTTSRSAISGGAPATADAPA